MPISCDDLLMVGCVTEDIERLYKNRSWCPVLATDEMVGTKEIFVFDWSKNALTHVMQIGSWKLLQGLAYEVEVAAFDELMDPSFAKWNIESFTNEATSGNACHITHIYGFELRAYPANILEITPAEQVTMAAKYSIPNYRKFRGHPGWASSLRFLAARGCYSVFYDGCEESLIEVGIEKGYITPQDVVASRKRRGIMDDYSI